MGILFGERPKQESVSNLDDVEAYALANATQSYTTLEVYDDIQVPLDKIRKDIIENEAPVPIDFIRPAAEISPLLSQLSKFKLKSLYVADDLELGVISQWNDQTSNEYHVTAAVGEEPNVIEDNDGRRAVAFSDSNRRYERLRNNDLTVDSQDHTCMVVMSSYGRFGVSLGVTFDADSFKGGLGYFSNAIFTSINTEHRIATTLQDNHNISFLGLRTTPTEITLYNENNQEDLAVLPSDTYDGISIGCWGSSVNLADANVYCVIVFDHLLSDEEFNEARKIVLNHYDIQPQIKTMICDGDSLTEGALSTQNQNYPFYLKLPQYKMINDGTGSDRWTALNADFAAMSAIYYDASKQKNIIVVMAGINDLIAGFTPSVVASSAETYSLAAKAAGWTVVQVTILPTNAVSEARRNEYTDLVLAGSADLVIDTRLIPFIGAEGDNNDTTYYHSDGTHMINAGYKVLARHIQEKIQHLL